MRNLTLPICFLVILLTATANYAKSGPQAARAAGQKLFARHCAECHGPAAEGTDRAPSLRRFVKSAEPTMLQSFIKNGNLRAGMPSWSRLPDQQLWQLVAYLQTLDNSPE